MHAPLQRLKRRRMSALRSGDNFAVEYQRASNGAHELTQRRDDFGELLALVASVPRHEPNALRRHLGDHTHAVVLLLEYPPSAGRNAGPDRRVHRLDRRHGSAYNENASARA